MPRHFAVGSLHVDRVGLDELDGLQKALQVLGDPLGVDVQRDPGLRRNLVVLDADVVRRVRRTVVPLVRVPTRLAQNQLLIVMRGRVRPRVDQVREGMPIVIADDIPVAIEDAALHGGVAGLVEVDEIYSRRHQAPEEIRLGRLADADRRVLARTNEPDLEERAVGAEDERGEPTRRSASYDDDRAYGLNHVRSVFLPAAILAARCASSATLTTARC